MKVSDIRDLVSATLSSMGLNPQPFGYRILCRNGFSIGMRFVFEGVSALWLGDVAEIRFVNDDGEILKIVSLSSCESAPAKAA